jgi:hypothetical protein
LDTGFRCVKCGKETLPQWVKRNRVNTNLPVIKLKGKE